jgi:hypothetical protein
MSGAQQSACGKDGAQCSVCSGADKCVDGACSSTCDPTTCVGCCDGNECKGGSSVSACGTNGQACETCTGDQQCVNGTCNSATTCSAGNCNGCCKSGVCEAGTSDSMCGDGGEVCTFCKWYQMCSSKDCTFDPESLWFVDIVEVSVEETSYNWDLGSGDETKPDLFVEFSTGTASHTTATINDSHTAVFDEYMFLVPASDLLTEVHYVIKDRDTFFHDTVCDVTEVIFQSEIENGSATIYTPCTNGMVTLKLKFY